MTVVRVKGVKRYRAKGRWYAYHRKTGVRLKAEFGTGEFFAELAALERRLKTQAALPGTLGLTCSRRTELTGLHRSQPSATRQGYAHDEPASAAE